MVVPFIALIVILIGVVLFFALAGKKNKQNRDLGDRSAGNSVHTHSSRRPGMES